MTMQVVGNSLDDTVATGRTTAAVSRIVELPVGGGGGGGDGVLGAV